MSSHFMFDINNISYNTFGEYLDFFVKEIIQKFSYERRTISVTRRKDL